MAGLPQGGVGSGRAGFGIGSGADQRQGGAFGLRSGRRRHDHRERIEQGLIDGGDTDQVVAGGQGDRVRPDQAVEKGPSVSGWWYDHGGRRTPPPRSWQCQPTLPCPSKQAHSRPAVGFSRCTCPAASSRTTSPSSSTEASPDRTRGRSDGVTGCPGREDSGSQTGCSARAGFAVTRSPLEAALRAARVGTAARKAKKKG